MEGSDSNIYFNIIFQHIEPSKSFTSIVRSKHGQTIGDVIKEHIESHAVIVKKIFASTSKTGEKNQTEPNTPVDVLAGFNTKFIQVNIDPIESAGEGASADVTKQGKVHNVFDVLMRSSATYSHLPKHRNVVNAKDRMHNDIVDLLQSRDVSFKAIQVETVGLNVVKTLTNVLWYIDPHHHKFHSRGIKLPKIFSAFVGYNNWHVQKRKEPVLNSEDLQSHLSSLVDMIAMPWFFNKRFLQFRNDCEQLAECLNKYLTFLNCQKETTAKNHASLEPVRSLSDHWAIKTIELTKKVSSNYRKLDEDLNVLDFYEPLFLYPYEPRDRFERRHWYEKLAVSYNVKLYTLLHGNYFGNFHFLWKCETNAHDDMDLRAIDFIKKDLPHFSTRAMRQEFIFRYAYACKIKPAILRNAYHFLTQDSSAAEHSKQAEVDERVVDFLMNADDPMLFYDLRRNNGRPKDERLKPFWTELQRYLDEVAVVHDRRQSAHMYLPLATSVKSLVDLIRERLGPNARCPSVSWLRLNFWPANAYRNTAINYTGEFKVRYAVQQRILRQKHPDSQFAFQQFLMLKDMAVKLRDHSNMVCLDDKSIIPVGEPGKPVSTGVRAHNRALVPDGVKIAALDHDFHIHGAVPSVLFHVNIPENVADSFYDGTLHVTVKEKVFQPSSAQRHMVESMKILRSVNSEDGVNIDKPILFVYTDGGPDHRTNFWSVQFAYILLFFALDLDLLIAARTAPSNSYANPAERSMSLLNLALQHCSFQRNEMEKSLEFRVRSLSTMKKVREVAKNDDNLKQGLMDSLEPVIAQLKQRFSHLKLHEAPVQIHDAANDDELQSFADISGILSEVDGEGLTIFEQLQSKDKVKKNDKLMDFISRHCRERQYTYQIKKCQVDCWYCTLNPPKMSVENFASLNWLPDPTLNGEKDEYLPFSALYGKETTDKGRPGAKGGSEVDKENRDILVGGKVRSFIICSECGKRRVIYCKEKLSTAMCRSLDRVQEELVYTCGSPLFPVGHEFWNTLVVREGLDCDTPIETTYYAEDGNYLALDLGGTNFRVLLINLQGQEVKMESKIYLIPQQLMTGTGVQLFDHIAECIYKFMSNHDLLDKKIPLGFTFSFPCKQIGLDHAILAHWTKGFKCEGVEGEDVVRLLHEAIKRRGDIDVECLAVINDTVGALMSCAHSDRQCAIGLILGTGTNACYIERIPKVELWDGDDNDPKQVMINTEWGALGDDGCLDFIKTEYDRQVDKHSINPGKQIYEKMISGMYMGEIVRLVLEKLRKAGLIFSGKGSEELSTRGRFYTKYVSEIESDVDDHFKNTKQVFEELALEKYSDEDCRITQYVCSLVSTRAAFLASAGIAVLLNKMERPQVTVGVDGSLYRFHPHFHDLMMEKIAHLVNPGIKFKLMLSHDGSGKGAAIVTAVANRLRNEANDSIRDERVDN